MEDEETNLSSAIACLNVNAVSFIPNINAVEFVPSFGTRSETAGENGQTNNTDSSPSMDTKECSLKHPLAEEDIEMEDEFDEEIPPILASAPKVIKVKKEHVNVVFIGHVGT